MIHFSRPSADVVMALPNVIALRRDNKLEELVVQDDLGHPWLLNTVGNVDPLRSPRARLGYLLGRPFANVAQVELLSEEHASILRRLGLKDATKDCFVSRLGSSYGAGELPCRILDHASAAELVFSLWIRRRDAHNENRSFTTDGLPVFFDYDVAFLAENEGADVEQFFAKAGPGYAGSWRIEEVAAGDLPLTTEKVRSWDRCNGRMFVASRDTFKRHCQEVASQISSDLRNLQSVVDEAGVTGSEKTRIVPFLERGITTLREEVCRMFDVVLGNCLAK